MGVRCSAASSGWPHVAQRLGPQTSVLSPKECDMAIHDRLVTLPARWPTDRRF